MKQTNDFKIDAVLENIYHPMTADGYGFGELIFSITNEGEAINASDFTMAMMFPGQPDKHPVHFPEGITILKNGQSAVFTKKPSLTRGSGAVIVVTRNSDGKEIIRTNVRDIP
jgi:hypothetical protein